MQYFYSTLLSMGRFVLQAEVTERRLISLQTKLSIFYVNATT